LAALKWSLWVGSTADQEGGPHRDLCQKTLFNKEDSHEIKGKKEKKKNQMILKTNDEGG
jgi:hypothetical protein